jgi:hypothetical protein
MSLGLVVFVQCECIVVGKCIGVHHAAELAEGRAKNGIPLC